MKHLPDVFTQEKVVVNRKVPYSKRTLEQKDQYSAKAFVLRQRSEDKNSDAREDEELNDPQNEEDKELLEHDLDNSDERAEGLGKLEHDDHPQPESARDHTE